MARAKKNTVDYFPHNCIHGKTLKIFESKFEDGYKFWFKLLELLGQTPNHFYDCKNDIDRLWLVEYCLGADRDAEVTEMVSCLAVLGAIDIDLWENNSMIWSQNFVDNLETVYNKRSTDLPIKPKSNGNPAQITIPTRKPQTKSKPVEKTPQSKVEYSKVIITRKKFEILWKTYPGTSEQKGSREKARKHIMSKKYKHTYEETLKAFQIYGDTSEKVKEGYIKNMITFLNGDFVTQWLADEELRPAKKKYRLVCPKHCKSDKPSIVDDPKTFKQCDECGAKKVLDK